MTVNEQRAPLGSVTSDLELGMTIGQPKIALGRYSKSDLERMGANFYAVYPIALTHRFGYLLTEIDAAEEEMCRTLVKISAIR